MSDDGGWDVVTAVIVPLAERLEAASKAAYPAGTVTSVTLDVDFKSLLEPAPGLEPGTY